MQNPYYKDLILIGGGHSHVQVVKKWGMNPIPGVQLTLISAQVQSPYSGMLPGLIAGHYDFDETHIDLVRLCHFAKVRFIQATVTHIDLNQKDIHLLGRPPIAADVLSINTGITPNLSVPGANEQVTSVKPIANFYSRWQALQQRLRQTTTNSTGNQSIEPVNIGIVGGGAAGVELILSMHYHLNRDAEIQTPLVFHLVQKGQGLPENYPAKIQRKLAAKFSKQGIRIHEHFDVEAVVEHTLHSADKRLLKLQEIFWCTAASATAWPKQSQLATDNLGFIAVNSHLQSTSHKWVFAAGDIASQQHAPRPKAGVFAVRQGPVLAANLNRYLLGQPLKVFRPQKHFLSLLACGEKYALGNRRSLSFAGKWVWYWKDHIDRRFMATFSKLPPMQASSNTATASVPLAISLSNSGDDNGHEPAINDQHALMRCGGCGAKIGAPILTRVLTRIEAEKRNSSQQDNIILSLNTPDDAAAFTLPSEQLLLQSVDFFRSLVEDPYLQGRLTAHHALNDIFAMHGQPHSAQAIVVLPHAGDAITERNLYQLMTGALSVFDDHRCQLIGGHTGEGVELSIGFSVNGTAQSEDLLHKSGMSPGEVLILTKALGTGTLFAAHMHNAVPGASLEKAIASMDQSNALAADILYRQGASACTDVSGFGLSGHLLEMLRASHCNASLKLDTLPVLEGALRTLQQGYSSSLQLQNRALGLQLDSQKKWREHPVFPILFDPQTSGGLLASLPADRAAHCVKELQNAGYRAAALIGKVESRSSKASLISLQ